MFAHGETFTRLRASSTLDSYNNAMTDWSNPNELPMPGVGFDAGGSAEPGVAGYAMRVITQPQVITWGEVYDVIPGDRLRRELTGKVYEVEGDPEVAPSPFTGWLPGQLIKLKIVEG